MNKYYVYAYVRLDYNSYFYIGKGKNGRWKDLNKRNPHFKNIINKIPFAVEILYENLTEEEAFKLEMETIEDLVFNEGYSIEIPSFCEKNVSYHLCNQSFGGEGSSGYKFSDETKKKMSKKRKGNNNSFYGKTHSYETKQHISEIRKIKGLAKGKNNPMYGRRGKKSPIKGRKHSQEELYKMSTSNPNRKEVFCLELNMKFTSLTKAEQYIKQTFNIPFSRKRLVKILNKEINQNWYGEIFINDKLIKLHWKYI